ncbi:MAG: glycerol dehydrogenase [Clostridia bacterium]
MERITKTPLCYIQEDGCLQKIAFYTRSLGEGGVYAVMDPFVLQAYGETVSRCFASHGVSLVMKEASGVCCRESINRMIEELHAAGCDVVAGIGGGKALDLAKAVAHFARLPVMVVPTSAATDAPCSAISVLYTADGVFDQYLTLHHSPDLVLVDTRVIANAPARLLAAGMGDAMATYYEADSCYRSDRRTNAGGRCSLAALSLAAACRDTLFRDGYAAYCAAQEKRVTPALENVVEANIYLSGIGFESGGLSIAHAVNNGLSAIPACQTVMHGEKVAFGTLVQLWLEGNREEFGRARAFHRRVGLPVTLHQLGLDAPDAELLMPAAELACDRGDVMGSMPEGITPQDICQAMIAVDQNSGKLD